MHNHHYFYLKRKRDYSISNLSPISSKALGSLGKLRPSSAAISLISCSMISSSELEDDIDGVEGIADDGDEEIADGVDDLVGDELEGDEEEDPDDGGGYSARAGAGICTLEAGGAVPLLLLARLLFTMTAPAITTINAKPAPPAMTPIHVELSFDDVVLVIAGSDAA